METAPFEELEFEVGGYVLRGRLYGAHLQGAEAKPNFHPVIALHGWLDNCASFSFIAPKLVDANCVVLALDLAGHGRSDHRVGLGAYNIWQDIPEILDVAEQMKWDKFGLIGHSRGAMISTLLKALCPEKVSLLGLIDGIVPIPIKEEERMEQFRRALVGAESARQRPRTQYDSFTAAVKAREKGFIALEHPDALVLAERGVQEENGYFYWANDKKLLIPSEVKFNNDQITELISELKGEAHLIVGSDGLIKEFGYIVEQLKAFPKIKIHHVKGGHHLHMSQAATQVANIFIAELQALQN